MRKFLTGMVLILEFCFVLFGSFRLKTHTHQFFGGFVVFFQGKGFFECWVVF